MSVENIKEKSLVDEMIELAIIKQPKILAELLESGIPIYYELDGRLVCEHPDGTIIECKDKNGSIT